MIQFNCHDKYTVLPTTVYRQAQKYTGRLIFNKGDRCYTKAKMWYRCILKTHWKEILICFYLLPLAAQIAQME